MIAAVRTEMAELLIIAQIDATLEHDFHSVPLSKFDSDPLGPFDEN